jgi:uncharacterized protein YqeY
MSLTDQLQADMKIAMKARDKLRLSTIRMILTDLKNEQIERRRELDEAEELAVLDRQARRRRESIKAYRDGGREDLADSEAAELEIIKEYLPKPLTAEEVESMVKAIIDEVGATSKRDFGKVMKTIMPKVKGRFPGKEVQPIVNRLLGG